MAIRFSHKEYYNVPVIITRGLVVFPEEETSLEASRAFTISAIKLSKEFADMAVVVSQKNIDIDEPLPSDVFTVGTLCKIKPLLKNKGVTKANLVGMARVKLSKLHFNGSYYEAHVTILDSESNDIRTPETEAMIRQLFDIVDEYSTYIKNADEFLSKININSGLNELADSFADNILLNFEHRQTVLEIADPVERINKLCELLSHEIEVLKLEMEISSKVRYQMDKSQREYYLKEQLKVLQNELSEEYPGDVDEIDEYIKKIENLNVSAQIKEKMTKEALKLEKVPFSSPEYSLIKTYLDTCLDIPFKTKSDESLDLDIAKKILDDDHYGLLKVKDRIYEFIAARKYNPEYKGQILCFVGPPGVGKTSIAASIAKAVGREMVRISLGGIHDEADIRGHRKTYIGAMPGRIINAVITAKVMNPLILFDEIDKLGVGGYHGDPSSALLEVLDVEQNRSFRDHFVEFPVDLSDCMFICTANTTATIPRPLLDRMEIVELNTYTINEKIHIAKNHLIPKQLALHSLNKKILTVSDKALKVLIEQYTKESGVRNLEREIAKICRKSIKKMYDDKLVKVSVNEKNLCEFLGTPRFIPEKTAPKDEIGLVNGLAWTELGGEILQIEAAIMPGTGKIELTGSLGDIMKESAHAAVTYIRTHSKELSVDPDFYKNKDIHLHFPDGATPKDGPSAGIAITTCLISALTGIPVKHNIAMTGEVTIRGRVLPIGGLKEKTMAAAAHKMSTVLIPADNNPDLDEIDSEVREKLEFIPVTSVDEVIKLALTAPVFAPKKTQGGNCGIKPTSSATSSYATKKE